MTYTGVVRNGRIELPAGASLPEGATVLVELSDAADPIDGLPDESVETGISDLASAHDSYACGARTEED